MCACSIAAHAQVSTGSISGTIVDSQGAAIPGATVKAVLVATGQVFTTTSNSVGSFRVSALPIGTYRVDVSQAGFRQISVPSVEVAIAVDRGLGTLTLDLGSQTTSVEVSAGAAPLIEESEAQVTNTFSDTVLSNFSGIQENEGLDNLALFVPGVVSSRDTGFSNANGGLGFSSNGLRGRNNDQEIDGQNNNDNSIGGPSLFLSDSEFVQQYDVITNNFGAEYGRNAGSVVNIATKSGTNNWHGSVYGNENNSVLNSLDSTAIASGTTKPPRANEEFTGGTIGGPIVRNKMFIFGGFDDDIVATSTVYNSANVTPTPAGLATLAGCFNSGPSAAAVSALTRFGPFGETIGNPVATPTGPNNTFLTENLGGCNNVQVGGVTRTVANPTHSYNWVTRYDYQIGSRDTFSARYLYNKTTNIDTADDNPVAGYFVNIPALSQGVLLSETHNFTSRMTNDFRVGFDRENVQFGGSTNGTAPTDANILNGLANVTFLTATQGFGVGSVFPQGRVVDTWQVQDNWSYLVGRNQFKAGVNFTHQVSPNTFLPEVNGIFVFNGLNDFVSGQPQSLVIAQGSPNIDFTENDTFLYFADDLKLKQNLTLNLGLTWSYFSQPNNVLNKIDTQNETGPNPLFNPALPLSVRTSPVLPVYEKALGPSVGFAYTPQWGSRLFGNGKTVIRGGFRLAYDPPYYNIYLNNYDGTPNILQATLLPTAANPLFIPANPTGAAARALAAPLLPLGQLDPRNFGETVVPQNFRPDQVISWSFGVQRELSRNLAFEIRYAGNHASNLFQSVNANPFVGTAADPGLAQVFPNLLPAGVSPCTTAGAPGFGRVNCNEGVELSRENSGSSSYNGLQTELRAHNLFNQLTLQASYTFSKALDNASEIFGSGLAGSTTSFAQNPFNITSAERGLSGLDIPHQFSLVANEELPFFKGQHGWLGHLAGGWGLSSTYIWASGQPYTPIEPTFANSTEVCDCFDNGFLGDFNNGGGVARPFVGSPSAPGNTVGIFAGDACTLLGTGCSVSPTQLISLNAANSGAVQNVASSQVRFIANTGIAQTTFGTPFGNATRNSLRDAPSNTATVTVYRNIKFNERLSLQFRATAENVFNHANFSTVIPDLENAGLTGFNTGFGVPSLTGDSLPGSSIAASRRLFFGLTFRY
jgi:Carboxypeptidase regulatory-like domain